MITIIYSDRPPTASPGRVEGQDLWLSIDELRQSTGWEVKEEGACIGDLCVPIPDKRQEEFLRNDGALFNLTALARLLGQPTVHDETHETWLFGATASSRRDSLLSLRAPDFTLPDLEGRSYSLSDSIGKKILLVSWASW